MRLTDPKKTRKQLRQETALYDSRGRTIMLSGGRPLTREALSRIVKRAIRARSRNRDNRR